MSLDNECCICYEIMGETNNCVTQCGHRFCLSCIITTMKKSSVCPCCRFSLREDDIEEEEEDTDNEEYDNDADDEEESNDDEEDDDDDDDDEVTTEISTFVKRFENNGISLLDITALFLRNEYHIISKKFTNNQMNEIDKKICFVIDEIKSEESETLLMSSNDLAPI